MTRCMEEHDTASVHPVIPTSRLLGIPTSANLVIPTSANLVIPTNGRNLVPFPQWLDQSAFRR